MIAAFCLAILAICKRPFSNENNSKTQILTKMYYMNCRPVRNELRDDFRFVCAEQSDNGINV